MDEKHYPYEHLTSEVKYDFWSISSEKQVRKRVIFTASNYRKIYNLALVDVFDDDTVSDITETRNKDMRMVLVTVIRIVNEFLEEYPNKMVVFRGSDERRQRLYRLIISRELTAILKEFSIFGGINGLQTEPFKPDTPYEYFLIVRRNK